MTPTQRATIKAFAKVILGLARIAVVAAIIYPVFSRPYIDRKEPCLSNLKMKNMGALIDSADYEDRYPFGNWMDGISTYIDNQEYFHDTTAITKPKYGYSLRDRALGKTTYSIQEPSKFILIFDSVLPRRNQHSELWSLPQTGSHSRNEGETGWDCVLWADGHAKSLGVGKHNSDSDATSYLEQAMVEDDISQRSKVKNIWDTARATEAK